MRLLRSVHLSALLLATVAACGSKTSSSSGSGSGGGTTHFVGSDGVGETSADQGATSGEGPAVTSGPGPSSSVATSSVSTGTGGGNEYQDCVDIINMYRATIGAPPYARWTDGEMCVDGQAKADSQSGTPHSAFGQCNEWAQDECPGWPGPPDQMIGDCLAAMWAEGPGGGHYDNMSSTMYTKAACGYYTLGDGSVWATQDFQ